MVYHQSTSTLFWIPHSNMNKRPLTEAEKESCTCGPARLRQHFFFERVVNIWNKLNYNTVCASSLNSFKNHLDNMYKDGSSSGLCQSAWPSRPSQSHGEALSGKLSVKYFCRQITQGSHHYYFFRALSVSAIALFCCDIECWYHLFFNILIYVSVFYLQCLSL